MRRGPTTADRIARLAPQAARLTKQTLRGVFESKVAETPDRQARAAMDVDSSDPYAYADSAEHREGIAAFLAKRKPRF